MVVLLLLPVVPKLKEFFFPLSFLLNFFCFNFSILSFIFLSASSSPLSFPLLLFLLLLLLLLLGSVLDSDSEPERGFSSEELAVSLPFLFGLVSKDDSDVDWRVSLVLVSIGNHQIYPYLYIHMLDIYFVLLIMLYI